MGRRSGEPIIYLISVKDGMDKKKIKNIVEKIKRAERKTKIINASKELGTAVIELPPNAPIHKLKKEFNFKLVV